MEWLCKASRIVIMTFGTLSRTMGCVEPENCIIVNEISRIMQMYFYFFILKLSFSKTFRKTQSLKNCRKNSNVWRFTIPSTSRRSAYKTASRHILMRFHSVPAFNPFAVSFNKSLKKAFPRPWKFANTQVRITRRWSLEHSPLRCKSQSGAPNKRSAKSRFALKASGNRNYSN